MLTMPTLETERLLIRPFTEADYPAVYQLLDRDLADPETTSPEPTLQADRQRWLAWTVLNYDELARIYQPPYGDRAVVLKATQTIIGACGYVPCLGPFGQLPTLATAVSLPPGLVSTEWGLYYAIDPQHRQQGYASEAAAALLDYAFNELHLWRVIATTDYDNAGSLGVMRRVGMTIAHNPLPTPPWLQAVGVLQHPKLLTTALP